MFWPCLLINFVTTKLLPGVIGNSCGYTRPFAQRSPWGIDLDWVNFGFWSTSWDCSHTPISYAPSKWTLTQFWILWTWVCWKCSVWVTATHFCILFHPSLRQKHFCGYASTRGAAHMLSCSSGSKTRTQTLSIFSILVVLLCQCYNYC